MIPDSIHRRKVYKSLSSSTCFLLSCFFLFIRHFPQQIDEMKNVEWNSQERNYFLLYGPTKRKEKIYKIIRCFENRNGKIDKCSKNNTRCENLLGSRSINKVVSWEDSSKQYYYQHQKM